MLLWKHNSELSFFCYGTYVAVNNINTESSVLETQQWIPFNSVVELQHIV
jgi:hypothetical protein